MRKYKIPKRAYNEVDMKRIIKIQRAIRKFLNKKYKLAR